ncbi:MAG: biotin--[acetyl-CoA-carboxylase] ligase [Burkholderiaceae bacterium]|jgi:BirA family biotin operon repressor/biotin-[acetyl-CoA-carboxylase] ligase|nr:biotin--[acetyl-CoA-carboxylase] ligase [Burkholderiaceae bacterium]
MMAPLALSWPRPLLERALAPLGARLEIVSATDSTNTELMRRARAGDAAPTLLLAETQTAGRGRLGRRWQGADRAGGALTFSLGVPLALGDWSGLSLAVGLALAESLHPRIGLKWPNDLWWQGRKLAGILIETATGAPATAVARHAVIGIGLNVAPLPGEGLRTPPAWLQEIDPQLSAPAALARVLPALADALANFAQTGFAPWAARFNTRDALANAPVVLSGGTQGTACGVNARGALRVQTAQGLREVSSAEVSVRPNLMAA